MCEDYKAVVFKRASENLNELPFNIEKFVEEYNIYREQTVKYKNNLRVSHIRGYIEFEDKVFLFVLKQNRDENNKPLTFLGSVEYENCKITFMPGDRIV